MFVCLIIKNKNIMRLYYSIDHSLFIFDSNYHQRHVAKEANFKWDPDLRKWTCKNKDTAASLVKYVHANDALTIEKLGLTFNRLIHIIREIKPHPEPCMVCLEHLEWADMRLTICGHFICVDCLQQWDKTSCPMCRSLLITG